MQAVGVLLRIDRQQQWPFNEASGQGQLQQDAVAGGVGVEALHSHQHLLGGGGGGQVGAQAGDAHPGAGLLLVGHIDAAGGIVADTQHGQTRGATDRRQLPGDGVVQAPFDRGGELLAVEAEGHAGEMGLTSSLPSGQAG